MCGGAALGCCRGGVGRAGAARSGCGCAGGARVAQRPRASQWHERKKPLQTGGWHFVLLCCGPPKFCSLQVCYLGDDAPGNSMQHAHVVFSLPNGDSWACYYLPSVQAEVWHCLLNVISPLLFALTRCHSYRF